MAVDRAGPPADRPRGRRTRAGADGRVRLPGPRGRAGARIAGTTAVRDRRGRGGRSGAAARRRSRACPAGLARGRPPVAGDACGAPARRPRAGGRARGRGRSAMADLHGASPALAVARVLDGDAERRELVAQAVRRGEVAWPRGPRPAPRAAPRSPGRGRRRSASGRIAEHLVEIAERSSAGRRRPWTSTARSIRRLRSRTRSNTTARPADTLRSSSSASPKAVPGRLEAPRQRRRRPGRPRGRRRARRRPRRADRARPPAAASESSRVVEAGPVVDRDQRQAQGPRRDAGREELADPGDVAGRLGHLRAAHLEMGAVEPRADERLAGRRLALGDLVLVVREDEVDAAGVDVERRPEVGHAHRRAFDVPAGPARADGRLPDRLAGLGTLPQGEVADVVLAVLVGLDPLPHPQALGVETGQPPVGRPRRDPEEDRAVVGPVGVAALEQRRDEGDDLVDVAGRPRQDVRASSSGAPRHRPGTRRDSARRASSMVSPVAAAPRMILSSISVMFMTQVTG